VTTNRLLGALGLAVALHGAISIATAEEAAADVRVRIGGSARVHVGGPRVYARPYYRPHYRPYYRPRVHVGGQVWVGGGYYYERPYAQPPPPPAPDCDCGPAYYPPLAPAPVTVVAAPVVEERLPRFGIGAFLGGVSVDGEHEGEDVGLVGQLRLGNGGLLIEGEIAKNTLDDGGRVDRRYLIGLTYELGARRRFAPYITAGIGTTQVEVENGWEDQQAIAEIGAGLRWRLSNHLSVFGDIRFGSRESMNDESDAPAASGGTLSRPVIPDEDEHYSRLRLGGMLTF
jgi:hypothetical protein